jgi:hypothetical protein
VGFEVELQDLLTEVLTGEGYTVGAGQPDLVLAEAGRWLAAEPVLAGPDGGTPVVLLATTDVAPVPVTVRAVVPMPFAIDDLLGTVARAVDRR